MFKFKGIVIVYSLRLENPTVKVSIPIKINNQTNPPFKNSKAEVPNPAKSVIQAYIGADKQTTPASIVINFFILFFNK